MYTFFFWKTDSDNDKYQLVPNLELKDPSFGLNSVTDCLVTLGKSLTFPGLQCLSP